MIVHAPRALVAFTIFLASLSIACTTGTAAVASPSAAPTDAPTEEPTAEPDSAEPPAGAAPSSCSCPCASATTAIYPGVGAPKVSLHGTFFERASSEPDVRRGLGLEVPAESVSDGQFLDRFQQWDEGPVWWEHLETGTDAPWIELTLDGSYALESAIVQADNNDSYRLSYRDRETGSWKELWTVEPVFEFGMVTRPNEYDNLERHVFAAPVTTDALRFEAKEGDGMYSVSEIEVFGARSGS